MTIIRAVLHHRRSDVWTSTLIQALAACDVRERNARQTINRMSDTGIIASEKIGARARWRLTDQGRRRLELGRKREAEFSGVQEDWDGQWLIVLFSVPETERDKRRRLRGRLEFAGFGFLQSGMAVSTHLDKEPFVNEVLKDFGLETGSFVLKARPGELLGDDGILHRAWDLGALSRNYALFINKMKRLKPVTDEERFAAFIELERLWFYIALQDPELPRSLLPARWAGQQAKPIYDAAMADWRDAALAWFERVDKAATD